MDVSRTNADLEALKKRPMAELQGLWRERATPQQRNNPPRIRSLLARDLAWWAQQSGRQALDTETQRLLQAAVKQAEKEGVAYGESGSPSNKPAPRKARRKQKVRPAKPQLQPGVTLIRQWRGKTYRVTVVENSEGQKRYRFADREYRSLTPIAEAITGAHWSGPRFFGLHRTILAK